jgi:hypothetical protein
MLAAWHNRALYLPSRPVAMQSGTLSTVPSKGTIGISAGTLVLCVASYLDTQPVPHYTDNKSTGSRSGLAACILCLVGRDPWMKELRASHSRNEQRQAEPFFPLLVEWQNREETVRRSEHGRGTEERAWLRR